MLEFMHWLPDRAYRPEKLFDHIQGHDLLLLGTALPDWMACFFLRATRRSRLSRPSDFTQYIVDHQISKNARLSAFLQNFGTAMTIFAEGDPVAFVDELHSRCKAAGIVSKDRPLSATDAGAQAPEVFLSYASENRDAAFTAKAILETRGLRVWLDKAKETYFRLSSGAEYEQQIRDRIHQATAFVPLLSRVMTSFEDRFFRKEWRLAAERLPDLFGTGRSFIIPVLIDDTPLTELRIPKEFRDREIKNAPDGRLTEEISSDIVREIDLLRVQRSRPR